MTKLSPSKIAGIAIVSLIGLGFIGWGVTKIASNKLDVNPKTLYDVMKNPKYTTEKNIYKGDSDHDDEVEVEVEDGDNKTSGGSRKSKKRSKKKGKKKTKGQTKR